MLGSCLSGKEWTVHTCCQHADPCSSLIRIWVQVADESELGREAVVLGTIMRGKASQAFKFIVCELPVRLPCARLGPDVDGNAIGIGAAPLGWCTRA